jgi:hypothetical protein
MRDFFCSVCGKPCRSVNRDFGFGSTEYWGAVGTHTQIVTVSECCDGDLLNEAPTGEGDCDE